MKYTILFTTLAWVVLLNSPVRANEMMNVDQKVQKMKAELNLTDDQANQIKPIIQDYKNQMEQAKKNKEDRLRGVLSSQQMDQMKEKHKMMKHSDDDDIDAGRGKY